eukprot:g4315.t1
MREAYRKWKGRGAKSGNAGEPKVKMDKDLGDQCESTEDAIVAVGAELAMKAHRSWSGLRTRRKPAITGLSREFAEHRIQMQSDLEEMAASQQQSAGQARQMQSDLAEMAASQRLASQAIAEELVGVRVANLQTDQLTRGMAAVRTDLGAIIDRVDGFWNSAANGVLEVNYAVRHGTAVIYKSQGDMASLQLSIHKAEIENSEHFKEVSSTLHNLEKYIRTRDLQQDRSMLERSLKKARMYLNEFTATGGGDFRHLDEATSSCMDILVLHAEPDTLDAHFMAGSICIAASFTKHAQQQPPARAKEYVFGGAFNNVVLCFESFWTDPSEAQTPTGRRVVEYLLSTASSICMLPPEGLILPQLDSRLVEAFGVLCSSEPANLDRFPEVGGAAVRALLQPKPLDDLCRMSHSLGVDISRCDNKADLIQAMLDTGAPIDVMKQAVWTDQSEVRSEGSSITQPEEMTRAMDRRSPTTGFRSEGGKGGRAPSSTVVGGSVSGRDPTSYALPRATIYDEEFGSADEEDEEEVAYHTQQVDDQASTQYARGYGRDNHGADSDAMGGGRSFDEGPWESDEGYSARESSALPLPGDRQYARGYGRGNHGADSDAMGGGRSFDEGPWEPDEGQSGFSARESSALPLPGDRQYARGYGRDNRGADSDAMGGGRSFDEGPWEPDEGQSEFSARESSALPLPGDRQHARGYRRGNRGADRQYARGYGRDNRGANGDAMGGGRSFDEGPWESDEGQSGYSARESSALPLPGDRQYSRGYDRDNRGADSDAMGGEGGLRDSAAVAQEFADYLPGATDASSPSFSSDEKLEGQEGVELYQDIVRDARKYFPLESSEEAEGDDGGGGGDDVIEPGCCSLCERVMPLTRHHVMPKSTHKRYRKKGYADAVLNRTITICRPCHSAVHRAHDAQTLAERFTTLEELLADETVGRFVAWARKQRTTSVQDSRNNLLRYRR